MPSAQRAVTASGPDRRSASAAAPRPSAARFNADPARDSKGRDRPGIGHGEWCCREKRGGSGGGSNRHGVRCQGTWGSGPGESASSRVRLSASPARPYPRAGRRKTRPRCCAARPADVDSKSRRSSPAPEAHGGRRRPTPSSPVEQGGGPSERGLSLLGRLLRLGLLLERGLAGVRGVRGGGDLVCRESGTGPHISPVKGGAVPTPMKGAGISTQLNREMCEEERRA
jgi:hypothetical protein